MSTRHVPPGYEVWGGGAEDSVVSEGNGARRKGRVVVLKSAAREKLLRAGVQDPEKLATGPLFAGWVDGGRTRHSLIRSGGDQWVLKAYRRGGVIGGWNSERYWGYQRFLDELCLTATAERRGVSTAEVLALIFSPAGFGSVRSWIVTRYLPDVRPLHEFYDHPEASSIFYAAGRAVARMHEAGIDHLDLHTGNIVGAIDARGARTYILDWDRARCRAEGTWNPHGNLVRLWRSVEKSRKKATFTKHNFGDAEGSGLRIAFRAFVRGYFVGQPDRLRAARDYFRRQALWLGVRSMFWRARSMSWRLRALPTGAGTGTGSNGSNGR